MTLSIRITHHKKFIAVIYHNNIGRKKSKTFHFAKKNEALDFAITIDERYVTSCCDDMYEYAVECDHDILHKKNWTFIGKRIP